jgi:tetratricopeptide (TPR) repeat protein
MPPIFAQDEMLRVVASIDNKEYESAEADLKLYLEENPKDMEALELLGDTYGHQEKWDLAIKTYTQLTEQDRRNAEAFYKLGGSLGMKALSVNKLKALMLVGDIREALENALLLDPKHIDAHWALIEYYMALPGILGGSSA